MSIDQRDPVAAATSPHKLCPFWSRVAYTKKGLLALCSYYDLENQREKGYGEPEGWLRLEKCQVDRTFSQSTAQIQPTLILNGKLAADHIPIMQWIAITRFLEASNFDRAWELALAWANEEVER